MREFAPSRLNRLRACLRRHIDDGYTPGIVALVHQGGREHVEVLGTHRGDGGDRLGHRREAEDGVARHRPRVVETHRAEYLDMFAAAVVHQGDDAGGVAAIDVSAQGGAQAVQPG